MAAPVPACEGVHMWLLFLQAAFAACPATSGDLVASVEAAEAAFAALDVAAFRAATNKVTAEANCLADSASRPVVARLHRIEGLRAFVDGDTARADQAFAAARAIEPAYTFPEALVPEGHPVRVRYTALSPQPGGSTALPSPTSGYLTLDARSSRDRPADRPALLQVVGDDGGVRASAYLWPGDPPPSYDSAAAVAVAPPPVPPTATKDPTPRERKGPNLPLAVAAGASLAVAGGTMGLAAGSHAAYYAEDARPADLDGLRARTNGLYLTSVGTGVLGVGLGVGAVLAGRW